MTSTLTALVLRLRELREKATPPPLVASIEGCRLEILADNESESLVAVVSSWEGSGTAPLPEALANIALFVEAVNALPSLLDAVEGGRAEGLEEAAKWHERAAAECRVEAVRESLYDAAQLEMFRARAAVHEYDAREIRSLSSKPSALVVENERLRRALANCVADCKEALNAYGGCDHSVGICSCEEIRHIEEAEVALSGESQREEA